MTIRLLSPDIVRNRCEAVSRRATFSGALLFALTLIAAQEGWVMSAAILVTLGGGCFGVSIGALLVERRFR